MSKPKTTGLKRIINATGYSLAGLKATYIHESAFRQELLLCILLIPVAFYQTNHLIERALLISSLLLILIIELVNSAIETIVDRFGGEIHPLSGRAKDIGSAAVLLTIINAVIIWSFILWPE